MRAVFVLRLPAGCCSKNCAGRGPTGTRDFAFAIAGSRHFFEHSRNPALVISLSQRYGISPDIVTPIRYENRGAGDDDHLKRPADPVSRYRLLTDFGG
jgi:hypothetical protein